MQPIHIIGLGMGPEDITPGTKEVIAGSAVLAGGRRLLAFFPDHPGDRLPLTGDVAGWLDQVTAAAESRQVAVLASGDPGFFGIAARVVDRFGRENVVIHPAVTAAQAAFARLKMPWQEARIVSIHGRDDRPLWGALCRHDQIAVYTDPVHSPDWIAKNMLDRDQTGWRMFVLSDLGSPEETVGAYTLEEASRASHSRLNIVVLTRVEPKKPIIIGAPEEAYHHEAGLITKSEVRTVALGKLELVPDLRLWDLGAGCGSVSIEASALLPEGLVFAVEKNADRIEQIRANRQKFGAANVSLLQADLPRGLDTLPDPDRVFIGGGGDALPDIIQAAGSRLPLGGKMVVSVVMFKSLETARKAMITLGLTIDIVQIQISRSKSLAGDFYLHALNPVWLITGQKAESKSI